MLYIYNDCTTDWYQVCANMWSGLGLSRAQQVPSVFGTDMAWTDADMNHISPLGGIRPAGGEQIGYTDARHVDIAIHNLYDNLSKWHSFSWCCTQSGTHHWGLAKSIKVQQVIWLSIIKTKQGNSVARDLPRTGSEANTTIFVLYILDIYSHCPYLLSGETTSHLTSSCKWRGTFQYFPHTKKNTKKTLNEK